jgi:hypothetical protein
MFATVATSQNWGNFLLINNFKKLIIIKKKTPALAPSQNLLKEPLDWMVA